MFTKELTFFNEEDNEITISTDGVVLKQYNEVNDGYDYKIIANVAAVHILGEGLRIYGSALEDGYEVWHNDNELVGWSDQPIPITIVDETYRCDDLVESDITVISDGISEEGAIIGSFALVLYHNSPTLYVKFDSFNEESFREVISIVSKLYL